MKTRLIQTCFETERGKYDADRLPIRVREKKIVLDHDTNQKVVEQGVELTVPALEEGED